MAAAPQVGLQALGQRRQPGCVRCLLVPRLTRGVDKAEVGDGDGRGRRRPADGDQRQCGQQDDESDASERPCHSILRPLAPSFGWG
ncbi:hypothetical protein AZA_51726 [Nitrospirillum viridazoti Y2]|nr:hypothetical protein AZA_51726 [Nitrospirillum amazonense Y2]